MCCREHDRESTRSKFKTNLKSFFGKARALGRQRQPDGEADVDEGAAAGPLRGGEEMITNVSGVDPAFWPAQQFGEQGGVTD